MVNTTEISSTFDIASIRKDFPILGQQVNGNPLVYLDNGATAQKPQVVIQSLVDYYQTTNANVHRGVHYLSQKATDQFEQARKTVQQFIHAKHNHEVLFTRGTTEAINTIADCFARGVLKAGDEVIISALEHHSNIVPWQMACERTGALLKVIPQNQAGELDQEQYALLLSDKTKIVAITHVSNALGTINPVKDMIQKAHAVGAAVLVDGAQAAPHCAIDVQDLDADFYCFSGHKVFGPTGIGVLYGKEQWLNQLPPYHGGGEMIETVTFEKTTYAGLPHKFEAGTPDISGAIALGTALDYMTNIGLSNIANYEAKLLQYATEQMQTIDGFTPYGTAKNKASVLSFLIDGIHPYDLGSILDQMGVAIRTGHHCAQPIMAFFSIPGTARASFAFYNNQEDIDNLVTATKKAVKMLR